LQTTIQCSALRGVRFLFILSQIGQPVDQLVVKNVTVPSTTPEIHSDHIAGHAKSPRPELACRLESLPQGDN
jgi:hypothetical protein